LEPVATAKVELKQRSVFKVQRTKENGGIMKKVYVTTVMVLLFSAALVSFSYAGASCCDPGAGCCSTSNVSRGQQQLRASSGGPSQAKVGTANKPAPQINPMPWSASVNQIGKLQRVLPAASPGIPGTGCCPGTNSTRGCCGSDPKSTSTSGPGALSREKQTPTAPLITEIFAVGPSLGTLW